MSRRARLAPRLALAPASEIRAPSPFKAALDPACWPLELLDEPAVRLKTVRGTIIFVSGAELAARVLKMPADRIMRHRVYSRAFGSAAGRDAVTIAEGALWREARSWLAPLFRAGAVNAAEPALQRDIDEVIGGWEAGTRADIHLDMTALSLRLAWRLFFADEGEPVPEEEIRRAAARYVTACRSRQLDAAASAVRGFAERVVDNPPARPLLPGNPFSRDGARAAPAARLTQALALLNAAHETTSAALSWMIILTGGEGPLQAALRQEVGSAESKDRPLVEAVIHETLRLFPSPPILLREAAADVRIGELECARGQSLAVNLYAMHRHSKVLEDPDVFRPERWLDSGRAPAFLPFGDGPHSCAGRAAALLQMRLVLTALCSRYTMRVEPDAAAPAALLSLHPAGPVGLELDRK